MDTGAFPSQSQTDSLQASQLGGSKPNAPSWHGKAVTYAEVQEGAEKLFREGGEIAHLTFLKV